MSSIKTLKKKIKSTKSTLKITSAMKLVSAAKLARSQAAINNAKTYMNEISSILNNLKKEDGLLDDDLLRSNSSKRNIILVISSNRGLCGGYNSQLANKIKHFLVENKDQQFELHFIGKKGQDHLVRYCNNYKLYHFEKADPTSEELLALLKELSIDYKENKIGRLFVAYNYFQSSMTFIPKIELTLPVQLNIQSDSSNHSSKLYLVKPSSHVVFKELMPRYFSAKIINFYFQAQASEHSSRMLAMDNATNNCSEAIKSYTLTMNKKRQASITKELIEVVSGAESLNG